MACGWRLYGDLRTLATAEGSTIEINLITGLATIDGEPTSHYLHIAAEIRHWLMERIERDQVPTGVIVAATLALTPSLDPRGLEVACSTRLETSEGVHESADTARWHGLDVR